MGLGSSCPPKAGQVYLDVISFATCIWVFSLSCASLASQSFTLFPALQTWEQTCHRLSCHPCERALLTWMEHADLHTQCRACNFTGFKRSRKLLRKVFKKQNRNPNIPTIPYAKMLLLQIFFLKLTLVF